MRKRLRKKLKMAEFSEYGFFVTGSFNAIEDNDLDMFFEKLAMFAEDKGMQCGGGYTTSEFEIFVNTGCKSDDNEAKRTELVAYLEAAKAEVKEFEATELLDAYNADSCCGSSDCDCNH